MGGAAYSIWMKNGGGCGGVRKGQVVDKGKGQDYNSLFTPSKKKKKKKKKKKVGGFHVNHV